MAEEDRSTIDLERPSGAIGHVARLRGHGVGEAKLIRGYQSIGHDPDAVPTCDRLDGGIQIDGRRSLQHTADPRQVVESVADAAQPAGFHEAGQGLVDGLTAGNVQEVLRRAQRRCSIVFGDPLHDLIGRSIHWIASASPLSVRNLYDFSSLVNRQMADGSPRAARDRRLRRPVRDGGARVDHRSSPRDGVADRGSGGRLQGRQVVR